MRLPAGLAATPSASRTVRPMPLASPTSRPVLVTPTPLPTEMLGETAVPTTATHWSIKSTPIPTLESDWLIYLNQFRYLADLPPLVEDTNLSLGSRDHSAYMVNNDNPDARDERRDNPYFTEAGRQAARNGNIFASPDAAATTDWAINFWLSAPFHAAAVLNPQLQSVGYAEFHDDSGLVKMAAVLDVKSGLASEPVDQHYPVYFPGNGRQTWIIRHSFLEYPDPLASCPGYEAPTGPPLLLQLGPDIVSPHVTDFQLEQGGQLLAACLFDQTTYRHEDEYAQELGRSILAEQRTVVLIPRYPLQVGSRYTVTITANGMTYRWHFDAVARPTTGQEKLDDLSFIWPVSNYEVYQSYWSRHPAIDILLPVGSPVWASAPGVVTFAGWQEKYGQTVMVNHGSGVLTRYAHLNAIYVRQEERVTQYTLIGASGDTGNSDMPHLHFEMIVNYYHPANPCDYLEIRLTVPAPFVTDPPLPKLPSGLSCGQVVFEAASPSR